MDTEGAWTQFHCGAVAASASRGSPHLARGVGVRVPGNAAADEGHPAAGRPLVSFGSYLMRMPVPTMLLEFPSWSIPLMAIVCPTALTGDTVN
jgi:hypothetical protein